MIYDPLIDELAALPLNLLIQPADQQTEEGQTACWCPFCKGAPASGKSTPHFIIRSEERRVGKEWLWGYRTVCSDEGPRLLVA